MCITIFGRDCFDYSACGRNNMAFFCNITVLGAGFAMVEGIWVRSFKRCEIGVFQSEVVRHAVSVS